MLCLAKRLVQQRQRALFNNSQCYSSSLVGRPTSQQIRDQFLDYFVGNNDHTFVRSSPVVPFCDPTVAFVNAGMNQFKNVFLGTSEPRYARVANTQKCVRVGGKHNDLSVVGTDGYHHTFFEMMGNWSFGDYFKKEACELSWNLLTGPYGLDKNRMFVTYFGGDPNLGLDADYECREIWLNLGIPSNRIIPFGPKDNFWEMGSTGPCGPCTEIHYDHIPVINTTDDAVVARSRLVNAGLPELTEIWNLVFIQYNRDAGNLLTPLPKLHVDTGMGMERLTAVLQKASSNYTTDLFTPIFDHISTITKSPPYADIYNDNLDINTAYRIVADHSRMITACLSDGMFPDQNHKLRRVIRKVFNISKNSFGHPDLLPTIIPRIVDILGPTYPEMISNQSNVLSILENESELYRALLTDPISDLDAILVKHPKLMENDIYEMAGFVPAFRQFESFVKNNQTVTTIPGDFAFKMYDTYGLRKEHIEQLVHIHNLEVDILGFEKCLKEARNRTRNAFVQDPVDGPDPDLISVGHAYTENELKYNYRFNWAVRLYTIPKIRVKVLAISPTSVANKFDVVLDQSTFYPESGGQESDQGVMVVEGNKLVSDIKVTGVRMGRGGVLIHTVQMDKVDSFLSAGDTVDLRVDNKRRTANILNHTATHILNACVKKVTDSVTYQRSSSVSSSCLKLELAVLGKKVDTQTVRRIQESVQSVIEAGNTLRTDVIDSQTFYTLDGITRIPGEVYPDRSVRIVSIVDNKNGVTSREPCCGTHSINTREIEYFCITHVRHSGRGAYEFTAVTGRQAKVALEVGDKLLNLISRLGVCNNTSASDEIVKKIAQITSAQANVPHHIRIDCQEILSSAARLNRELSKASLKEHVETEIQELLTRSPINENPFLVHILKDIPATSSKESVPLLRATKLCSDRPVLIACLADGSVRARCTVPRRMVTPSFGATQWLQMFASVFDGHIAEAQKGQKPEEVCVMKERKIPEDNFEGLLKEAVSKAKKFAELRFGERDETETSQSV